MSCCNVPGPPNRRQCPSHTAASHAAQLQPETCCRTEATRLMPMSETVMTAAELWSCKWHQTQTNSNLWPAGGYLSSNRTWTSLGQYKITLLGDDVHIHWRERVQVCFRARVKPTISQLLYVYTSKNRSSLNLQVNSSNTHHHRHHHHHHRHHHTFTTIITNNIIILIWPRRTRQPIFHSSFLERSPLPTWLTTLWHVTLHTSSKKSTAKPSSWN